MSSHHLVEEWIGGIVDLRILFQTPKKDEMIICEIGEYSRFWRLKMVGKFMLKSFWERKHYVNPSREVIVTVFVPSGK
jgi:hypothetical protein